MRKNALDEQLQSIALFVCNLHAVIGDLSVLYFLSVLRINNLRVFNTCRGSTPAASTTFIWSGPETWVTECTGYMGNTFGPKGFELKPEARIATLRAQKATQKAYRTFANPEVMS